MERKIEEVILEKGRVLSLPFAKNATP